MDDLRLSLVLLFVPFLYTQHRKSAHYIPGLPLPLAAHSVQTALEVYEQLSLIVSKKKKKL